MEDKLNALCLFIFTQKKHLMHLLTYCCNNIFFFMNTYSRFCFNNKKRNEKGGGEVWTEDTTNDYYKYRWVFTKIP